VAGFGDTSKGKANKSSRSPKLNFQKWFNQAIYFHQKGRLREAESIYKKMIAADTKDPAVFCNLGIICKNSSRLKEALEHFEEALELEKNDPIIYSNIGNLYRAIGSPQKALQFTLRSVELDKNSSDIYTNLGSIYRDLEQTNEALEATVKAIELDSENKEAAQNLKALASDIKINSTNRIYARKAYEILLLCKDFSHRKLNSLFIEEHLESIHKAAQHDPIISDLNEDFHDLASDWRFRKSLTLLIPPHQDVERFLCRLRTECLQQIRSNYKSTQKLKPLLEALATQCFLNEFVYWQSENEKQWIKELIDEAKKSKESFNQLLPIIGCYTPIHDIRIEETKIREYPVNSDESKAFINTQYKETKKVLAIQSKLIQRQKITDPVSLEVKKMYEENPYPRYQYADHTPINLARPIDEFISLETTTSGPIKARRNSQANTDANILIAGCGTGNQIINASRYKNARITAIDVSKKSLAYAAMKLKEYRMNNVYLEQLDILNVSQLQGSYDVIECSGVLHHMQNPSEGLAALTSKLRPGGYIKLGLYSSIARKQVSAARSIIQQLGFTSNPDGIRQFRKAVLGGDLEELKPISISVNDFYSLSECRDLCFHVKEHLFTTTDLEKLLDSQCLEFCGFMLPGKTKISYREKNPDDNDMTSLKKWGEFEMKNPLTFQSMYQFWAKKSY